jgi:hypothetical protein
MTPRQIMFTKHLLSGATLTAAARKAGYSEKNLTQSGHQVLQSIRLKRPELMERLELTPRVLIEKYLVPLLSAATTKCFHHKGKIIYSRTLPDYRTRVMALDMVFRLMGAYAPNQSRQSPSVAPQGVRIVIRDAPRSPRPAAEGRTPICLPAPSVARCLCRRVACSRERSYS